MPIYRPVSAKISIATLSPDCAASAICRGVSADPSFVALVKIVRRPVSIFSSVRSTMFLAPA